MNDEKQLFTIINSMKRLIDLDSDLLALYHRGVVSGVVYVDKIAELTDDRLKQARLIMLQCEQLK
jgi:hypothetical protein